MTKALSFLLDDACFMCNRAIQSCSVDILNRAYPGKQSVNLQKYSFCSPDCREMRLARNWSSLRVRSGVLSHKVSSSCAENTGHTSIPAQGDAVKPWLQECSGRWLHCPPEPTAYALQSGTKEIEDDAGCLPPQWLSVAPMMMHTDQHFRYLARLITRHTWLYTEMVVDDTVNYNESQLDKFLEYPLCQRPLVLQLGGSDPTTLAQAARLAEPYGYTEVNLNCGCPSQKVAGTGCFGARLMLDPKLVGDVMAAISAAVSVPVTVKCRIGVDNFDSYELLCEFVATVARRSPTRHFIIHSRKALLKGLSPDQNRKIPPLKYEYVFGLIRDFPDLKFSINGGFTGCHQAAEALKRGVHGVMIGRAAYSMPWAALGDADRTIFGVPNRGVSRRQVLEEYVTYADLTQGRHGPYRPTARVLTQPLLGLFHSEPGANRWRQAVDAALRDAQSVREVLERTLHIIPDFVLDALPHEPEEGVLAPNAVFPEIAPLPPPFDQTLSACDGPSVEDGLHEDEQALEEKWELVAP